jgi:hypothetical protein
MRSRIGKEWDRPSSRPKEKIRIAGDTFFVEKNGKWN